MAAKTENDDSKYLPELMAEKDSIDSSFIHAVRLITKEIDGIQNPKKDEAKATPELRMIDIHAPKFPKVECILKVPVNEFPKVNFVGRIIGPGGSTLKGIQDVTNTRIAILGKGSQRDKKKAEELLNSGDPKWTHLKLPLHVKISAIAPVDQAHIQIGQACSEIMKLMQVDDTEYMDGNNLQNAGAQRGGGPTRGGPPHRGSPRGRGRGGAPRGGMAPAARGAPAGRGVARGSMRGAPRGAARGAPRGGSRAPAAPASRYPAKQPMAMAQPAVDPYAQSADQYGYADYGTEASYDAYASEYADPNAYADPNGADPYADPYGTAGGAESYGQESYDAYGYGADAYAQYGNGSQQTHTQSPQPQHQGGYKQQGAGGYQKPAGSKPYRGKMTRGGMSRGRGAKPY